MKIELAHLTIANAQSCDDIWRILDSHWKEDDLKGAILMMHGGPEEKPEEIGGSEALLLEIVDYFKCSVIMEKGPDQAGVRCNEIVAAKSDSLDLFKLNLDRDCYGFFTHKAKENSFKVAFYAVSSSLLDVLVKPEVATEQVIFLSDSRRLNKDSSYYGFLHKMAWSLESVIEPNNETTIVATICATSIVGRNQGGEIESKTQLTIRKRVYQTLHVEKINKEEADDDKFD